MSNPDRGAYTPPTDQQPLSFDARQPVRGRGPAPMMLFASALVLVVLIVAIVVFYRSGVSQGASGAAPPVVGAPVGAIKGAAPSEAQPADPAAGLQIYQQAEGQAPPSQPNFTPPPETPQVRSSPLPPVVAAPPPTPAAGPVAALPNSSGLKPNVTATAPPPPAAKAPAPAPVGAKPPAPAAVAAKPAPVAVKPAPVAAKPAPVAAKPAAAPPVAPKPAAAAPAAPKATTPKPAASGAAAGVASVQIGAFSSQALADKGWNDAAHIAPGAAAGKGKKVEAIQKGGATLYRTQVTGFSSRAAAQAFCSQLQAAGKSCFVK